MEHYVGYYIRILSKSDTCPSFNTLYASLGNRDLSLVKGSDAEWTELGIQYHGIDIAVVDRQTTVPGTVGAEEIEEFLEEIEKAKPESAAEWLGEYLLQVKAIYALHILKTAWIGDRFDHINKIRDEIWRAEGGIIQADNEGFTNEEGYHILWQFKSDVEGPWWMAVLEDGAWKKFEMDLGNPHHRKAFKADMVPTGIIAT